MEKEEKYLSLREFAELVGFSRSKVQFLVYNGTIKRVPITRSVTLPMIPASEADKFKNKP